MREGICMFSGHALPKGSGTTIVRADGKAHLLSQKSKHFVSKKIKPRFIRWTQQARTILKKENIVKEQKIEIPAVVKIVRGFPSVPAHIIKERMEKREKGKEERKEKGDVEKGFRGQKVSKSEMRRKN